MAYTTTPSKHARIKPAYAHLKKSGIDLIDDILPEPKIRKLQRKKLTYEQRKERILLKRRAREFSTTVEMLIEQKIKQDNVCSICGVKKNKLVMDHCHKSMLFRGFICNPCNLSLGWYEKNKTKMYEYLKITG